MKNYLALTFGVLFILGFAAGAFAIHAEIPAETQAVIAKGSTQITLGGEFRARGEARQNTADFDSDKGDHRAAYDSRVRLSIDAQVTPNTKGLIQVEAGDGPSTNNYTWGNAAANTGQGLYKEGETKRGTFNIIQAWIQHKGSGLLGVPSGIKVGHMPLSLGNRLFFDHTLFGDDAILLFSSPTKELELNLLTVKLREGSVTKSDDADAYVGIVTYRSKDISFGADVTYVNDQNAFQASTTGKSAHLWNFGVRGNAKVAGLGIKADAEFQTGQITDTGLATGDVKFRGYAFLAGLDYRLDPVKLTLEYAYGSGDDASDPTKFKTFVTSLSQVQYFTYVYDYRATTAAGGTNTGIANTQYLRFGAAAELAKSLTGDVNVYWLRAAKKVSVNLGSTPTKGESKNIGTEIDWRFVYKIDRNLNYFVEGGYLFAGGFYDTAKKNSDDAYAIRHGVVISF